MEEMLLQLPSVKVEREKKEVEKITTDRYNKIITEVWTKKENDDQ